MRLISLFSAVLYACNSSSSTENHACAENNSFCSDASSDASIDPLIDASLDSAILNLPFSGSIYGTTQIGNEVYTTILNLQNYSLEEFVDGNGNQLSTIETKALHSLSRPVISPNGNTLAFIKNKDSQPFVWVYDLSRSDIKPLFEANGGSQVAWKDDNTLFVTRHGSPRDDLLTIGIFQVDISQNETREVVSLPLEPPFFRMGITYEAKLDIIYFTCPPQHALPTTREEQNDSSDVVYQIPREICLIYANQPTSQYEQITRLGEQKLEMISEILIPGSFQEGVYFACRNNDLEGFCSASFENEGAFVVPLPNPSYIGLFNPTQEWIVTGDLQAVNVNDSTVFSLPSLTFQGEPVRSFFPIFWTE